LTLAKYELAQLTYKLLPHYLGKCSKELYQQHSTVILIKQRTVEKFLNTQDVSS